MNDIAQQTIVTQTKLFVCKYMEGPLFTQVTDWVDKPCK